MPKQTCRAAVNKMLINPIKFQNTQNITVPVFPDGSVTPSTLSWLKSLVRRKDLLEHLIAYGRKMFKDLPIYIVYHEDFVFFCYVWNDRQALTFLGNIPIVYLNCLNEPDSIPTSQFSGSLSSLQNN
jgi:hypothetical protein